MTGQSSGVALEGLSSETRDLSHLDVLKNFLCCGLTVVRVRKPGYPTL